MLSVKHLVKTYKTRSGRETPALRGVSVDFPDKGLVFLLGKSGSGKSTLLNLIGGIDIPTNGEIVINGRSSDTFSSGDFDSYRNTYIGFVFQEYNLIDDQTVGRNVSLALELQGRQGERDRIDEILRRVDLVDERGNTLFGRMTNELSGGQKQRVAIARALVKDPEIILADEPTGALDSKTGIALYELLKSLSKEKLVIVVTHDGESAKKYGDRIIELADGEIISDTGGESAPSAAQSEGVRLIRGNLPFKRVLAMGAGGLKTKKFRLALSVLLAVVAFSMFGFAFTASMTDEYGVEIRTLYDNDLRTVAVHSVYGDDRYSDAMTPAQLNAIADFNGTESATLVNSMFVESLSGVINHVAIDRNSFYGNNPYYSIGLTSFQYLAELDPITGAEDFALTPDERFSDPSVCRLPQNNTEIAITDIRASMFLRFGYKDADGVTRAINSPDDLIGKKLGELTISGVYRTEQDRQFYERYANRETVYGENDYFYNMASGAHNSILSYGFVCKGFSADLPRAADTNGVLIRLSGNYAADKALFDRMNYTEYGIARSVSIVSAVSSLTYMVDMFKSMLLMPFMVVAAVLAVFAALLMMNFLTVSIDFRKKELGILRALGARSKDVLGICLVESLIIALVDFALSLVCVCVVCLIVNSVNFAALFSVGFVEVLVMFALSVGVGALATALPVVRLTKRKPIDVINGK